MPHILIVDDSEADSILTRRALAGCSEWYVANARDGAQALEMLDAAPFDVIVSDIRMPRIDGLQLLGEVRKRHSEIPVVITTSHGSEEIAMQAIKAGAASYVPKTQILMDL